MSLQLVDVMGRVLGSAMPRSFLPVGQGLEALGGEVSQMGLRSAASCLTAPFVGDRGLRQAAEFVLVHLAQRSDAVGDAALVRLYEVTGTPVDRVALIARAGIDKNAPWAGDSIEPLARAAREWQQVPVSTSLHSEEASLNAQLASLGFDSITLSGELTWKVHPQWRGVAHTTSLFRDKITGTAVLGIYMAPFIVYPEHLHVGIKDPAGDKGEAVIFLPGSGSMSDWQGSYAKTADYAQVLGSIHTPWTGREAAFFLGIAWGGVVISNLPGTELADLVAASPIEGSLLSAVFTGVPAKDQADVMSFVVKVLQNSQGKADDMPVTSPRVKLLSLPIHPAANRAGLVRRQMGVV